MARFVSSQPLKKLVKKFAIRIFRTTQQLVQSDLPEFGNNPNNLRIDLPRRITNPERMFIGDDVSLGPGTFLVAQPRYPSSVMRHPQIQHALQNFDSSSRITIDNQLTSTGNLTLAAMCKITIEDDVMFASNVNLTDGLHGYENADEPYKYQKMWRIAPILVKRGCWIGQNVVILPGVTIGELAIIGANSVVTRSIAVGAPATVVNQWDATQRRWVAGT